MNVDKIVSGMRKLQPTGTTPLRPDSKIAQGIANDLKYVSTNKDYLIRTGDKILKLAKQGYDVKNLHNQWLGQYMKGNKAKTIQEWFIDEAVFLSDNKFVEWNNMLMEATAGAKSPGEYMLPIIDQMMAPAKLEDNPNFETVKNAIVSWENAFKAQVTKNPKFNGKFDSNTQKAWQMLMNVIADTAFATLSMTKQQPKRA